MFLVPGGTYDDVTYVYDDVTLGYMRDCVSGARRGHGIPV